MRARGARLAAARFWADELGAGTVFSIFLIMIFALLGGLVIDVNNAWRHKEMLKTTADVAVHAGVIELARGADGSAARQGALAALNLNTPEATYGRIVGDAVADIVPLHYDLATNQVSHDGAINAVSVLVQRSAVTGNPVPTYLLHLLGRTAWDISEQSVAALVPTLRCNSANGIYAQGEVRLERPLHLGGGVCVHSQDRAVPAPGSAFDPGAGLSMPDLARCGAACGAGMGTKEAATETNLILQDAGRIVDQVFADFTAPQIIAPAETDFFAARPLAEDLSALDEIGIDIRALKGGDVVDIPPMAFARLRALPGGLVYRIICPAGQGADSTLTLTGGTAQNEGGPEAAPSDAPGAAETGMIFRDLALMTNCALHLTASARIDGALVVSTSDAPFRAEAGARIGAQAGPDEARCASGRRSAVLVKGGIDLPAGALGPNAGAVTPADIRVSAGKGETAVARGVSLHAGGTISLAAAHDITTCAAPAGAFDPALLMIRHVLPGMDAPEGTAPPPEDAKGGSGPSMSRRAYGS